MKRSVPSQKYGRTPCLSPLVPKGDADERSETAGACTPTEKPPSENQGNQPSTNHLQLPQQRLYHRTCRRLRIKIRRFRRQTIPTRHNIHKLAHRNRPHHDPNLHLP